MKQNLRCNSCNKSIQNESGAVSFRCPNCSESEIVRCPHCREISAKYSCVRCNFTGPN